MNIQRGGEISVELLRCDNIIRVVLANLKKVKEKKIILLDQKYPAERFISRFSEYID